MNRVLRVKIQLLMRGFSEEESGSGEDSSSSYKVGSSRSLLGDELFTGFVLRSEIVFALFRRRSLLEHASLHPRHALAFVGNFGSWRLAFACFSFRGVTELKSIDEGSFAFLCGLDLLLFFSEDKDGDGSKNSGLHSLNLNK